ncbi:hypothetical protein ACWEBH_11845 [Micrococcus endophyticus]
MDPAAAVEPADPLGDVVGLGSADGLAVVASAGLDDDPAGAGEELSAGSDPPPQAVSSSARPAPRAPTWVRR